MTTPLQQTDEEPLRHQALGCVLQLYGCTVAVAELVFLYFWYTRTIFFFDAEGNERINMIYVMIGPFACTPKALIWPVFFVWWLVTK